MQINEHFANLHESYLFARVAERVREYEQEHNARAIRLSIGDVTRPLAPCVIRAMHGAVDDLSRAETFRGYGPDATSYAYDFLLSAIQNHYKKRGVALSFGEIFVSDGAKSDLGNLLDLFSVEKVLLPDPVYPAYADANLLAGHKIIYAEGREENGFLPMPEEGKGADLIYLCSPNNPTGAVYSHAQLKRWVEFAGRHGAILLFDAAYEAYVTGNFPRSVYEVEGARECAIEVSSFSKAAGFTGVRCGYTVIPNELVRGGVRLSSLWKRRQACKFNGVSYVTQRGAAAAYSEEGERECGEILAYYRENARILKEGMNGCRLFSTGGVHSPYLWVKCPYGTGEQFFELLLSRCGVAVTPGGGFGAGGERYFRLTAFSSREDTAEAVKRITELLT